MDDKLTIQNLNQMLATATGRLDVIRLKLEHTSLDEHDIQQLSRYVTKSVKQLDDMMTRHAADKRVVK